MVKYAKGLKEQNQHLAGWLCLVYSTQCEFREKQHSEFKL